MSRNAKVAIAVVAILMLLGGVRKLVGMAVLTALSPLYAIVLASVFFMIFVAVAGVVVPIGRSLLNRAEAASIAEDQTVIRKEEHPDEHRDAA
jgi:hypothetical protein